MLSMTSPVPAYPDFVPISLDIMDEMHPQLSLTPDGVSEFTFAGLYLFRRRYQYRVSLGPGHTFIISGVQPPNDHGEPLWTDNKKFFLTPCAAMPKDITQDLLRTHDYWKNIPESVLAQSREDIASWGIEPAEDRDNFDYLYLRQELAELSGKRFHKKKNLVNAFNKEYPDHEMKPLTPELIPQALEVAEQWAREKGEEGDIIAARETLELFGTLRVRGAIFYVNGKPAGWCLGESLAKGRIFAIHFEKALEQYKGIYQYINQAFAASLPRFFTYINREQDLGDLGLRQAKETYRPCGYVKKYTGVLKCPS
ncbi:MAG: phosphatidylglycerol lysyltransferase domain-containing protein [Treponema sp.]|nr:phosphatidylglycerol lysyltransferase domain-containing protein [Treponema sp.]